MNKIYKPENFLDILIERDVWMPEEKKKVKKPRIKKVKAESEFDVGV